jgi:integrase
MPRRRARGEGGILKREYKRPDGKIYKRYFARITTAYDGSKQDKQDGPMRATEKEAKVDLAALLKTQEAGQLSTRANQTLNDYLDGWLAQGAKTLKYRTYETYEMDLRNHVRPRLGRMKLSKIHKTDVQNLVNQVYDDAVSKGRSGVAVVRKTRAALRKALQDAVDLEILGKNPCVGVKVPQERVDETELWTPQQALHFLETTRPHRLYALFQTAITSGMRQGELLALRWRDLETYLDEETGELVGQFYIRNTLVLVPNKNMDIAKASPRLRHIHGRFFFDDPKTEKSKGYVTLPADTVEELIIHRFRQEQEKLRAREYHDYELVFPTSLGTPLGPKGLDDIYDLLIKKAEVPKIKFHDLRDTHATWMLIQGEDLGTVSDRLRHSTKSTTLNRYVQVINSRRRKAPRKISELFKES